MADQRIWLNLLGAILVLSRIDTWLKAIIYSKVEWAKEEKYFKVWIIHYFDIKHLIYTIFSLYDISLLKLLPAIKSLADDNIGILYMNMRRSFIFWFVFSNISLDTYFSLYQTFFNTESDISSYISLIKFFFLPLSRYLSYIFSSIFHPIRSTNRRPVGELLYKGRIMIKLVSKQKYFNIF